MYIDIYNYSWIDAFKLLSDTVTNMLLTLLYVTYGWLMKYILSLQWDVQYFVSGKKSRMFKLPPIESSWYFKL